MEIEVKSLSSEIRESLDRTNWLNLLYKNLKTSSKHKKLHWDQILEKTFQRYKKNYIIPNKLVIGKNFLIIPDTWRNGLTRDRVKKIHLACWFILQSKEID